MRVWLALILSVTMVGCATNPSIDRAASGSQPTDFSNKFEKKAAGDSVRIVKSPHGYVIDGPPKSFGGFVGDCASDENFPYYWQCQSENAGHGFR
jgi:hypothetical protein